MSDDTAVTRCFRGTCGPCFLLALINRQEWRRKGIAIGGESVRNIKPDVAPRHSLAVTVGGPNFKLAVNIHTYQYLLLSLNCQNRKTADSSRISYATVGFINFCALSLPKQMEKYKKSNFALK